MILISQRFVAFLTL